jgi:Protein of unknown function (DUF1236)
MRNTLMVATAAIALFAGTSISLAQQELPRSTPTEKMAPKAAPQNNGAMHNGAAEPGRNSTEERGERSNRTGQGEPNRGETTSQAPQERSHEEGRGEQRDSEKNAEKNEKKTNRQTDGSRSTTDQNRTEERESIPRNERSRETTGQGTAPTRSSASVSREDRTRIHDIIVKGHSAPRIDHADFSLSVGTEVPRSVRIVSVPSEIIEIEPTWRGFEYFMVGDQIVIVDPNTMEIVAILDV